MPRRAAGAEKRYDVGASDTEIKIGNTGPYSGPALSYGTIPKAMAAYYRMVNGQGGVNGRKINFISYDDAYGPPKTVEKVRKLVEQDGVLLIASPLGTPTNSAIWRCMNHYKVPQLFVSTGATNWDDPKHFAWTIGWQPNYQSEGRVYAAYILEHKRQTCTISPCRSCCPETRSKRPPRTLPRSSKFRWLASTASNGGYLAH